MIDRRITAQMQWIRNQVGTAEREESRCVEIERNIHGDGDESDDKSDMNAVKWKASICVKAAKR